MEKIKIGIDLDKTIFDSKSVVYNFLNYLTGNRKKKSRNGRETSYGRETGQCKDSVLNRVFKLLNPNFYFALPDAVEIINSLHENNYEIHLVTRRPNMKAVVALTLMSLKNHGIKYDKLVLGCKDKADYCKKNGLAYFIDNTKEICFEIEAKTKTKPIYFNAYEKKKEKFLKQKGKKRMELVASEKICSWKGVGSFFKAEEKGKAQQRKEQEDVKGNAFIAEFKKRTLNNIVAKGFCLPSPEKEK